MGSDDDVKMSSPEEGKAKPTMMDLQQAPPVSDLKAVAPPGGDHMPWVEKYRPKGLNDLVSHKEIISTIGDLIDKNRMPHLLLYGPPGTGKTSTILACARKINGDNYSSMILELNASDDRGIDVVREQIVNFASSRKLFNSGFKLIILDEADSMTKTAQFALRRVIEKYTKNTRFCIICNYINQIIPALQSRCTRFRFGPLEPEDVRGRLDTIAEKEGVKLGPNAMQTIIDLAEGDMRKCLNVLQACHLAYDEVTELNVYLCTGKPLPEDIEGIVDACLNQTFSQAMEFVADIQMTKGISLTDIIHCVSETVMRCSFTPEVLMFVLDKMSDVEYRLAQGTSEQLQLGSFVGILQTAASRMMAHSKSQE